MTSQTDTVGDVTSTSYDKAGNVKTQTDAKNNVTTTVYDVLGRTKGVTDRLTNETLYAYDLGGRLTSITDAQVCHGLGKTTSDAYNAPGIGWCAKTDETYPDHTGGNPGDPTYGKVKFTYDPAGRMIRREDQKGDTVTFNHTMAGTITSRDYRTKANSPSGTIADSDTFTFDNLGRMLTAVSGRYSNTVTMTYDSYGRLKDESLTLAGQTYTVTRAYDTRGRLDQLTYPNSSVVQRTYTTRSQLHTVKYLGTTVDTRTYDDGGRLNTSTYANGAVVTFAYRADNLPTSIATTHAGSPNIGTYSYSWDANKNKTAETITGTMSGFGFSSGATGYDDEDRLTTWNRTNGTMNQSWTLSAVGNWDSFTSAGSTWNRTHSNAHEFTGFTGAGSGTLAYDVKGNQTSRPATLSAPALNLDWNFDNQLRGADTNGSAGSLEVTFEYDALGRRVARSHSSGNVVYVHAGQQVIADYARGAVASSPTYRYVYADYVDEPILRHTGTATTLPTTGDNALYYHRNQQYSIVGLTNAAGTLVERYTYSAYGTLGIYDANGTVRSSSTYANRYTYTGREWDAELKLYHFRARWYDPAIGGFITRDPLGHVDGMSLYRGYFGVKGRDYSGTCNVGDCVIDAKMRAMRFRLVGYNDSGEVFDLDPSDFDPSDPNVFDPETINDITQELLEKLLKKFLARYGVGPALRHRIGNIFPTAEVVETWIDRVDLEVGFDVDCTRRDCVETWFYERWVFDSFCWARGIPTKLPGSKWQEIDFDCGGPYWIEVDTLTIDRPGSAQDIGLDEIVRRISNRNWRIVDNFAWSKVVLKMRSLGNTPPGCTVNVR